MHNLDHLPVIIGAGQNSRPVPTDLDRAFGPADLAGEALARAFADARLSAQPLDVCFGVRLFGDSGPAFPNPFGRPTNFPASVCARAGTQAGRYVYDHSGGQSPQTLVAEATKLFQDGDAEIVAIVGAEAIANIKAAGRAGAKPDWNEVRDEPLEDRGPFHPGPFLIHNQAIAHRISAPVYYYGLMETARRAALGESKATYRARMAAIWAEFADIAADNPLASERSRKTGEAIVTPGPDNPMITSPYTKAMVARDRVNLGAAVLLTTYGKAKALGVGDMTFLHAHDHATEPQLLVRDRLDRSEAQRRVLESSARSADLYDLYSCFPVVPLEASRILGLSDGQGRTLTGGLPFFGGPGNNYSLHAIAEAHRHVRGSDKVAVVYANGGMSSKHAVGRYGGRPPEALNIRKSPDPELSIVSDDGENPSGRIASYTVEYRRGEPTGVLLICETETGARFYARGDAEQAAPFIQGDPLDKIVTTKTQGGQNLITGI